ncbi:type II toxin-antitoxin system PrlF family antitoxin [Neisseria yangbaofengii]|uniref:type II toxin-antitoxin system PrlF family antitoxin n=1 Tax=Neisseria yangbaofengii TaxID=2709396 RepID=UPI001D01423F|nr:type II toxin-antitoxin system PrlF family antitoxin [Neisseria yangbaofengii]
MNMNVILNAVSTMTSKNQTTIPESVRKALGLEKQDKLRFSVLEGGQVLLEKDVIDEEECDDDPVVHNFLNFLEQSMQNSPESIRPASSSRYARYRQLAGD